MRPVHRAERNSAIAAENFYARPLSMQFMRVRSALVLSLCSVVLAAALHVASGAAQSRPSVAPPDAIASSSAALDGALVADASSEAGAFVARAEPALCGASERGVSFSLESSQVELACADGLRQCEATVVFRVRNCSGRRVTLQQAALQSAVGMLTLSFGDDWIETGTQAWRSRRLHGDRDISAQVAFVAADEGGTRFAGSAPLVVRNVQRAQAQAACAACRGLWGRWGMSQFEGCNCRTSDAGRVCEDGADCEAGCVLTGSRAVSRGMFVAVGRCAERRMNFGCRTLIEVGARARGPAPRALGAQRSRVCSD